jgi:Zn finger protein HypA/HybF involved in hydrogenase expression
MIQREDDFCVRCEGHFDADRLQKGLCPMCKEIDVWIRKGELFVKPIGSEFADAC